MVLFILYDPLNITCSLQEERKFKVLPSLPLNSQNTIRNRTSPLKKDWTTVLLFKLFVPVLKIFISDLFFFFGRFWYGIMTWRKCNPMFSIHEVQEKDKQNLTSLSGEAAVSSYIWGTISSRLCFFFLLFFFHQQSIALQVQKHIFLLCHTKVPFIHWGNILSLR